LTRPTFYRPRYGALSSHSTVPTPTRTSSPTRLHACEDPRAEIAFIGRKTVAVFGESVSVSVSAPWNASFNTHAGIGVGRAGIGER